MTSCKHEFHLQCILEWYCYLASLIESFGSIMGINFDGAGLYYVGNDGCFACLLLLLCTATVIAAVMCLGHRSGFLK